MESAFYCIEHQRTINDLLSDKLLRPSLAKQARIMLVNLQKQQIVARNRDSSSSDSRSATEDGPGECRDPEEGHVLPVKSTRESTARKGPKRKIDHESIALNCDLGDLHVMSEKDVDADLIDGQILIISSAHNLYNEECAMIGEGIKKKGRCAAYPCCFGDGENRLDKQEAEESRIMTSRKRDGVSRESNAVIVSDVSSEHELKQGQGGSEYERTEKYENSLVIDGDKECGHEAIAHLVSQDDDQGSMVLPDDEQEGERTEEGEEGEEPQSNPSNPSPIWEPPCQKRAINSNSKQTRKFRKRTRNVLLSKASAWCIKNQQSEEVAAAKFKLLPMQQLTWKIRLRNWRERWQLLSQTHTGDTNIVKLAAVWCVRNCRSIEDAVSLFKIRPSQLSYLRSKVRSLNIVWNGVNAAPLEVSDDNAKIVKAPEAEEKDCVFIERTPTAHCNGKSATIVDENKNIESGAEIAGESDVLEEQADNIATGENAALSSHKTMWEKVNIIAAWCLKYNKEIGEGMARFGLRRNRRFKVLARMTTFRRWWRMFNYYHEDFNVSDKTLFLKKVVVWCVKENKSIENAAQIFQLGRKSNLDIIQRQLNVARKVWQHFKALEQLELDQCSQGDVILTEKAESPKEKHMRELNDEMDRKANEIADMHVSLEVKMKKRKHEVEDSVSGVVEEGCKMRGEKVAIEEHDYMHKIFDNRFKRYAALQENCAKDSFQERPVDNGVAVESSQRLTKTKSKRNHLPTHPVTKNIAIKEQILIPDPNFFLGKLYSYCYDDAVKPGHLCGVKEVHWYTKPPLSSDAVAMVSSDNSFVPLGWSELSRWDAAAVFSLKHNAFPELAMAKYDIPFSSQNSKDLADLTLKYRYWWSLLSTGVDVTDTTFSEKVLNEVAAWSVKCKECPAITAGKFNLPRDELPLLYRRACVAKEVWDKIGAFVENRMGSWPDEQEDDKEVQEDDEEVQVNFADGEEHQDGMKNNVDGRSENVENGERGENPAGQENIMVVEMKEKEEEINHMMDCEGGANLVSEKMESSGGHVKGAESMEPERMDCIIDVDDEVIFFSHNGEELEQ